MFSILSSSCVVRVVEPEIFSRNKNRGFNHRAQDKTNNINLIRSTIKQRRLECYGILGQHVEQFSTLETKLKEIRKESSLKKKFENSRISTLIITGFALFTLKAGCTVS
jgi:hypothetical protein